MGINWKVRFKNLNFWLTAIPAVILLIQVVAAVFGFELDLSDLTTKLLALANAAFGVLALIGVVNDPTTAGMKDSGQAMTYDVPRV